MIKNLPFRVKNKHRAIRKCANRNCEKRTSCLHSITRYSAEFQNKVTEVFQNNETTCNEYIKVG